MQGVSGSQMRPSCFYAALVAERVCLAGKDGAQSSGGTALAEGNASKRVVGKGIRTCMIVAGGIVFLIIVAVIALLAFKRR